jgi:hypothetical protein
LRRAPGTEVIAKFVEVPFEVNEFVELAVVAKKFVVVAFVPVAFCEVKSRRVVEPERRRFESEVKPPVAVRVVPIAREPVKLAAEEIV